MRWNQINSSNLSLNTRVHIKKYNFQPLNIKNRRLLEKLHNSDILLEFSNLS